MDLLKKKRLYCPGGSVRDPLHNAPILPPVLFFLLGTFQKSVFDGLRRLGLSVGTSKHLPHRDFNMQTCSAEQMSDMSPRFAGWIRSSEQWIISWRSGKSQSRCCLSPRLSPTTPQTREAKLLLHRTLWPPPPIYC